MRERAFRPDSLGRLEGRSLLSGTAGAPVVLSFQRLGQITQRIQSPFTYFTRFHQVSRLREELKYNVGPVPYGRADGLDQSIDRIIDQMEDDLADRTPNAVRTAQRQIIMTMRAGVAARVRAGDVVLR